MAPIRSSVRSRAGQRKHARYRKWKRYAALACAALIFACAAFYLWSGRYDITTVTIQGLGMGSEAEVRGIVAEESGKKLWGFLPRRNWVLYPRGEIRRALSMLPDFSEVSVSAGFSDVVVSLAERKAAFTWCGNSIDAATSTADEQCYFVDNDGVVFADAPHFQGDTYLKLYRPLVIASSSSSSPVGSRLTSSSTLASLQNLKDSLSGVGYSSAKMQFSSDYEVIDQTKEGVTILAPVLADYSSLASTVALVVKEAATSTPSVTLSTIDARIDHKVFLKYR